MKLFAIGAFAAATLVASSALAQDAPQNPGPVLPGVCVVSGEQILLGSAAGQALQNRMVQLLQEVRGELQPYATAIQTEMTALQQGQIAGAGLDVYEQEPVVPAALRALENVTLLPHLGTAALEVRTAMGLMAVDNLIAFAEGRPPPNALP